MDIMSARKKNVVLGIKEDVDIIKEENSYVRNNNSSLDTNLV